MKYRSRASFTYQDAAPLIAFWEHEFEEHGMEHESVGLNSIVGSAEFGRVQFDMDGTKATVSIATDDASILYDIQSGICDHLKEFDPGVRVSAWSGEHKAGALLPNLTIGTVSAVEPLNNVFLRVTVSAQPQDLARFDDEHMHFRLLRRKNARCAPVWPRINKKGTVDWPQGDDELIDRSYTTRQINVAGGNIVFDVFRHEHGPTCFWLDQNPIGEMIGLVGPGGGGTPKAEWVLMGGDETAVPAILKSIETMPKSTKGKVFMLLPSREDVLPLPKASLQVTWLFRDEQDNLVEEMKSITVPDPGSSALWFAASKTEARDIRAHGRTLGISRENLNSAAYWD
ncbi:MAG: siderophore-interacting protein [Pseudomonadota bacterium]